MDALEKLKTATVLATEASDVITDIIEKKADELHDLRENIEKAQENLKILSAELTTRRADFKAKVDDHAAELSTIETNLEQKKQELKKTTSDVEAAKKNHSQFVKYEIEHQRALNAREASIAEREEAVASVMGQMKRRKKIVNELT